MSEPDAVEAWLVRLSAALGTERAAVDRDLLLDLARDAAHWVARPAAPLTTFLVGYAAGLRGGGPQALVEVSAIARRLAQESGAAGDGQPPDQTIRSSPA